jgi:hypothetical protein
VFWNLQRALLNAADDAFDRAQKAKHSTGNLEPLSVAEKQAAVDAPLAAMLDRYIVGRGELVRLIEETYMDMADDDGQQCATAAAAAPAPAPGVGPDAPPGP